MVGLARIDLRRPYTSAIGVLLIVLMGMMSITLMIVYIFPVIGIPVALVVWNYPGPTTEDMERRASLRSPGGAQAMSFEQAHVRSACEPRNHGSNELFIQAQFDHGAKAAILIEGDERPA